MPLAFRSRSRLQKEALCVEGCVLVEKRVGETRPGKRKTKKKRWEESQGGRSQRKSGKRFGQQVTRRWRDLLTLSRNFLSKHPAATSFSCSDVPLRLGDSARKSVFRAVLDCEALLFGQRRRRKQPQSRRRRHQRRRSTNSTTPTSRRAGHLRLARRLQPPFASMALVDERIVRQRA